MTLTLKTLAIAGLMGTISAPAFAAAHMGSDMTCEEYNELSGADRDKVAMMAIMELNDSGNPGDGTATATESSVGTTAEESEGTASTEGSATATSTVPADDDATRMAEEIRVLNRICSRNWDATVGEAAAGQFGTR
jgi:hypothetical protein